MYRFPISLLVAFIIFMIPAIAQKKKVVSIKWDIAGALPAPADHQKSIGVAGAVIGMHAGFLFVAGGANFPDKMPWEGGIKRYHSEGYVFKRNTDGKFELYKTFRLPDAMGYSANCSTPFGVVAAGGENENGYSQKVFLIKWDAISDNTEISELLSLPFAVTNASVSCIGKKIYLAGGECGATVSDKFLFLDLDKTNAGWQTLPSVPKPVSHAVMAVQEEGIFLIGGRKRNAGGLSELYASNWRFDLKSNRWMKQKSLPYALSAGTGISFANDILLLGGDKGKTFSKTESLIVDIANAKDENKKQELIQEKNKLQASHPGFSKEILLYNIKKNCWKKMGSMQMEAPVTTTAVLWNKEVIIPAGEIRAGVRTPRIIIGKIAVTNQ